MAYTIAALSTRISGLLQNRPISDAMTIIYAQDSALELSENYKFPGLQTTGPVVNLIPLQAVYAPSYFMTTADQALNVDINMIDSFFLYTNGYDALASPSASNTGYGLKFKTINDIEVLINIPGQPTSWTRHEGDIWLGCVPDQAYPCYVRYIHEQAFPEETTADEIYFPTSWKDIMAYSIAMRAARDLNLQSKANELYTALYGDSKFQLTSGVEGCPGLIFQRTSQERRDQGTAMKSMRLKMGRV